MPEPITIEAAADALLRVLVRAERERAAGQSGTPIRATPFRLHNPRSLRPRDAIDLAGLATDPVGAACRAELRRVGHAIHADRPHDDFTSILVEVAEMDPTHAGWRAAVLESAWVGIGDAA